MFPLEAIILKKTRIDEQRVVMTAFSSEYGKIDIFHKENPRNTRLDTLSYFTGQIRTKEHNTLTNIYRTVPFSSSGNYDLYDLAGWSVSILYNLLPLGLPYPKLFQILRNIVHNKEVSNHDFLLFLLHTCHDFGITKCNLGDYISKLANIEEH